MLVWHSNQCGLNQHSDFVVCSFFTVRIQVEEHKEKESQHCCVHWLCQSDSAQKEEGQCCAAVIDFLIFRFYLSSVLSLKDSQLSCVLLCCNREKDGHGMRTPSWWRRIPSTGYNQVSTFLLLCFFRSARICLHACVKKNTRCTAQQHLRVNAFILAPSL